MTSATEQLTYSVPGVSCEHCVVAIISEVQKVDGFSGIDVDLGYKQVKVTGHRLDDAAVRAAIAEAGYDIA